MVAWIAFAVDLEATNLKALATGIGMALGIMPA